MADLRELQKRLRVTFKDITLLQIALTHRSYVNENPDTPLHANERLEFLGDALLGFVVAQELYQRFPHLAEGELTELRSSLVRKEALAQHAEELNLGDFLYLGKGEEKAGGRRRQTNLACTFEAVVGAVLMDRGFATAKRFVLRCLGEELEGLDCEGLPRDAKSKLQQITQAQWKQAPVYKVVETAGPDHAREFTVEVRTGHQVLGKGSGMSKQQAEKEAARAALAMLKESPD